ncbi:early activation antigen cd69 [Plakobranchus ocellatus]|uniref:Early activation antigen cd69 n=1 Tax=Plakobranchus ocellatus TaxID=259542 RepID=A0AAV4CP05_9GAST|nr:early activation antigen cd69 [Plakobranchus ocellatus]
MTLCTVDVSEGFKGDFLCGDSGFTALSNYRTCYFYSRTEKDYSGAAADCSSRNAALLTIPDAATDDVITNSVKFQFDSWFGLRFTSLNTWNWTSTNTKASAPPIVPSFTHASPGKCTADCANPYSCLTRQVHRRLCHHLLMPHMIFDYLMTKLDIDFVNTDTAAKPTLARLSQSNKHKCYLHGWGTHEHNVPCGRNRFERVHVFNVTQQRDEA